MLKRLLVSGFGGMSNLNSLFRFLLGIVLFTQNQPSTHGGSILREIWENLPGATVNDLRNSAVYPNQPTTSGEITDFFEAPSNVGDQYGQRIHGYIVPPVTGNYTFWIASDDAS